MNYRNLGSTGLIVSEIGFGAWGIGGGAGGHAAYGPTSDNESINALHAALDAGITLYDTSDLYGMGHSEKLIGQAFQNTRYQVVIATKGGVMNPAGELNFSPVYLREALERSLARLACEYVDLYQLHSLPIEQLEQNDSLLRFLEAIVQEGKVRVVGISARSPWEALVAVVHFGFRSVQVNLSLLDWRAVDCGLLQRSNDLGAGVIARTPLCFGLLTGRYSVTDLSDSNDHRARWPREQLERWISAARLFGDVICSGGEQTASQKALRFCMSFSEVASVIPGMLTPDQVGENIMASELGELSDAEMTAVERIYRENIFMVGK
jgi:aryl-alcohol dehydrogenase-like predicted oxidoreductase